MPVVAERFASAASGEGACRESAKSCAAAELLTANRSRQHTFDSPLGAQSLTSHPAAPLTATSITMSRRCVAGIKYQLSRGIPPDKRGDVHFLPGMFATSLTWKRRQEILERETCQPKCVRENRGTPNYTALSNPPIYLSSPLVPPSRTLVPLAPMPTFGTELYMVHGS